MAWLERERPQWLAAVPHASALAAEAWCLAREQPEGLVWLRMESAVRNAYRASRARKRGPPSTALQSDPEGPAEASGLLARNEVEALLRARGVAPEDAPVFAAWLGGEGEQATMRQLGLSRWRVRAARARAKARLGLTTAEVVALVGRLRGEPLTEIAWSRGVGLRRDGNYRKSDREWARRRRGSTPVDPSTVSLRIKSALAKITGRA